VSKLCAGSGDVSPYRPYGVTWRKPASESLAERSSASRSARRGTRHRCGRGGRGAHGPGQREGKPHAGYDEMCRLSDAMIRVGRERGGLYRQCSGSTEALGNMLQQSVAASTNDSRGPGLSPGVMPSDEAPERRFLGKNDPIFARNGPFRLKSAIYADEQTGPY
jgi:hypothetical protein